MRIHISTPDDRRAEHASEIRVDVDDLSDAGGRALIHCRVSCQLHNGARLLVSEVQSGTGMAVSRAMQRLLRTVHRRTHSAHQA